MSIINLSSIWSNIVSQSGDITKNENCEVCQCMGGEQQCLPAKKCKPCEKVRYG